MIRYRGKRVTVVEALDDGLCRIEFCNKRLGTAVVRYRNLVWCSDDYYNTNVDDTVPLAGE